MASPEFVVVIGASAGGVESLQRVVKGLPKELSAAVCVVLHIPPYKRSNLPSVLTAAGSLPASHPEDGAWIKAGQIYVAPPDCHLLIEDHHIAVKKGPKENRFRPSIDALFRSAAYSYGAQVIGIILSGALSDGTSGMWTIKRLGGVSVVQKPDDALFDSMPLSAINEVQIDYQVDASDMGPLIATLIDEHKERRVDSDDPALRERIGAEVAIAKEGGAFRKAIMNIGQLTPFTCPECHGALVMLQEGQMNRYRCHTGHAFSESALLDGVMETTEDMLWQTLRSMEEAVMVLQHMARHLEEAGATSHAGSYYAKAKEIEARSRAFQEVVLKQEGRRAHERLVGE